LIVTWLRKLWFFEFRFHPGHSFSQFGFMNSLLLGCAMTPAGKGFHFRIFQCNLPWSDRSALTSKRRQAGPELMSGFTTM
jgi:hypothetical protein